LDSPEVIAPKPEDQVVEPLGLTLEATRKFDHSLAGNLAWTAITNWSSQLITWASFLIVARLLSPADFGIVGMAVILMAYLSRLGQLGIPAIVVTLRDLTDDKLAQLNSVGLALGAAGFGLSCALAYPMAVFFRTPRLASVVVVTCLALLGVGLRGVPVGLLQKDMRFRWLSMVDASCDILSAAVTLLLALRGFAYWALVLGNVAAFVVRTVIIVRARPYRFAFPRPSSIRKELLFGSHVLVSGLALSSYEKLDNVTAGRVLGSTALGFYGMAWNLANVPLEKVTTLVTTVLPSYLAAVQADPAALRRYIRTLTEGISLATFPLTVGLGLVARELVPLALGRKWEPAVPALMVLSIYAAFRSVAALVSKVLNAVGNARFVMWNQLAALIILPAAFYVGSHWGISGIAWGWVAAYPLVAFPLYWKTFKTVEMKVGEYIRSVRPALDGTLVMVLSVGCLKWLLPLSEPRAVRLILEVMTGAVAYTVTVLLVHRERALVFWGLAKRFRAQGRSAGNQEAQIPA
jgi:teichuronic acid exporter